MSKASNVLLAKSRAMFGKRLTNENVSDLLNCQTVTEVAAYLKNNTHYSSALERIDDSTVHRGQLEAALDALFESQMSSFSFYNVDAWDNIRQMLAYESQIKEILRYLRLLSAGRSAEYVFAMPEYAAKRSGIDAGKLSQVKSYRDFLGVMSGSFFFKTLRQMAPDDGCAIDYTMIEHALYSQLFNYMNNEIVKKFHGGDKEDLMDLLSINVELSSVLNIYRINKYYKSCGEDMKRSLVFDMRYKISKRTYERMLKEDDADKVLEIFLNETSYGRKMEAPDGQYIDRFINRMVYRRASHLIRFSTNPTVALVAYLRTSSIERRDIITIIEGVRYRLPPDDIASMITIAS